jgi:hypothetical protein
VTFSITTLSIKGLFTTFGIHNIQNKCHSALEHFLSSFIMLSGVVLSGIIMNGMAPRIQPCFLSILQPNNFAFQTFVLKNVPMHMKNPNKPCIKQLSKLFFETFYFLHFCCGTFCDNRTGHIRHKCRKTTVLSCHRCLINTCFEKMNNI